MKIKLDENLPLELLEELRSAGIDADSVYDEGLVGAPDDLILKTVQEESRVLLTLDKGIGDIRRYPPEDYAGIVLFRLPSSGRRAAYQFIRRFLPRILQADLKGHLLVIGDSGIRRR